MVGRSWFWFLEVGFECFGLRLACRGLDVKIRTNQMYINSEYLKYLRFTIICPTTPPSQTKTTPSMVVQKYCPDRLACDCVL